MDATLLKQKDAAADDKIDMFLIEADYALKYVDTDYTLPVKDLGIADSDIADQYKYTQDIVTDSEGVLKGLSWQGCPGVLFYNREAAKAVLGSDDAATVDALTNAGTVTVAAGKSMSITGTSTTSGTFTLPVPLF